MTLEKGRLQGNKSLGYDELQIFQMRVRRVRRGVQTLQFLNPDCLKQQRLSTTDRCISSTKGTAEGSSKYLVNHNAV